MSTAKSHKSKLEQGDAGGPSSTQRAAASADPRMNALDGILLGTPSGHMTPAERMALINEIGEERRAAEAPRELAPEKQDWWRPADSKMRPKAIQIVAWRVAGKSDKDIAKKLNSTEANIRQTLYIARKNGWLGEHDEPVETDIEDELAVNIDRKIVRNISAALDGQVVNWQTHEMTIAAAKGRGMFADRTKVDTTIQATSLVQIQVIRVDADLQAAVDAIPAADMGGRPAYIEGEVQEE